MALNDDQRTLRDWVHGFAENVMRPAAHEWDEREEIDAASADLVARRDAARAARDWGLADELRDQLGARGWLVEDGPDGTVVRRP